MAAIGSLLRATTHYRDRSGFPRGLEAARGAAQNFETPRDMRTSIDSGGSGLRVVHGGEAPNIGST